MCMEKFDFKNEAQRILIAIGIPKYEGITSVEIKSEELYDCDTYTLQCFYKYITSLVKGYGLSYTIINIGQSSKPNVIVIDRIYNEK